MAPALAAPRIGDVGEERREGMHVLSTQHDPRGSMVVLRAQHGLRQAALGLRLQWARQHLFHGARLRTVARAGTPIAAGVTHALTVGRHSASRRKGHARLSTQSAAACSDSQSTWQRH
jgi:hypothetical protein